MNRLLKVLIKQEKKEIIDLLLSKNYQVISSEESDKYIPEDETSESQIRFTFYKRGTEGNLMIEETEYTKSGSLLCYTMMTNVSEIVIDEFGCMFLKKFII